eukprot:6813954-Pyramimonas_sp.AAC.1
MSPWGSVRRRIALAGVSDPSGEHITDPGEVCAHLGWFWGRVHARVSPDPDAWLELRQYVRPLPGHIQWTLERDEFATLIYKKRGAAPGPDGLPFSAVTRAGDFAHNLLNNVNLELQAGRLSNPGFNEGDAVFLAKGSEQSDHAGLF